MKDAKQKIYVLTTGGTIEKTYDEYEGTLFNRDTIIKQRINERLRLPYTNIDVKTLISKDSLDMSKTDRELIAASIQELIDRAEDCPIVILHGTDTMQKTAELCHKSLKNLNVPVIFTGAMRPLGFEKTDAIQNVTEALIAAKLIQPGVYISFHNRLFSVPGVKKNHTFSTFESI